MSQTQGISCSSTRFIIHVDGFFDGFIEINEHSDSKTDLIIDSSIDQLYLLQSTIEMTVCLF